jgi:hypothetical protein
LAFLGSAGFLGACGHLPFEDIPDVGDAAAGAETGPIEGSTVVEGGTVVDGNVVDAKLDAGPCQGPTCVGTYVSGTTGNDSNPGTSAKPVQTIQAGIAIAVKLGGKQNVYVASTHYPEKVTLAESVHLLAGYDCSGTSCTWNRDIVKNDTAILDQDFEGVLAPSTVTRKTLFDGFRVVGKGGTPTTFPGSAAMSLVSGTPTVTRCRFTGGTVVGGNANARSIGVAVLGPANDPGGALIDQNAISGGPSADQSVGLLLAGSVSGVSGAAVAVVTSNTIRSDAAQFTTAVLALNSGAATLLAKNDIGGGTASTTGALTTNSSWGITVMSAMTIDGNHINTDVASVAGCGQTVNGDFCGGIHSQGSTTTIINNVVLGAKGPKSCAVLLEDGEVGVGSVILNANTLDGAGTNGVDGTLSTAVALRINAGTNATFGKVRNNILLGGTNKSRYGVYEDPPTGKTAHVVVLDNNDFWNVGTPRTDFAYRLWNGAVGTDVTFAQLGTISNTPPVANLGVDPLLDATWHLGSASPVIDKGTSTEAPSRDIDGDSRPKGTAVDIGADEAK